MNNVVLVGNPNAGKTTVFNLLTKSSEHTGNWHGVTVDEKQKNYKYKNNNFSVTDLPGIYSLTPLSFEEKVATDYLFSLKESLILNIVDINNLNRNLYLTYELLQGGFNVVLVVNKTTKNVGLNIKKLGEYLGCETIIIDASSLKNADVLKNKINEYFYNKELKINKKTIKNSQKIEDLVQKINNFINFNKYKINLNGNFLAKKCLENDESILSNLNLNELELSFIKKVQKEILVEEIAKDNYIQINNILIKCNYNKTKNSYGKSAVDKLVLNKYFCLPILFAILLIIFYLTFFSVGAFLSNIFSSFVQNVVGTGLLNFVLKITNNQVIYNFFEVAIVGGLGSVFTFLPQIIILFLCLSVLEDSGYLSRVAFSLDDIFSRVGLSGKSVYTLLMGFGCSTSACMTARTADSKNSQIKTAMLAPYMSCSAKLPIYSVIGSAFFGANNVFVIFAMYLLGAIVAICLSVFYEKTFLKSGKQSFILEFPPYRIPKLKKLFIVALDTTKQFLTRIATLLVSMNIIIWVLSSFSFDFKFVNLQGGTSMLESLGKLFCPIFSPVGFGSWGATSALIAGFVAKEIIVSSIAMFNGINANIDSSAKISQSLTNPASPVFFNPASAISYMVFCLLYSPCLATTAVLRKEIGKKWTYISIVVQFVSAYVISLIIYHSINLIMSKGIMFFLFFFLMCALFVYAVYVLISAVHKKRTCKNCRSCLRKK